MREISLSKADFLLLEKLGFNKDLDISTLSIETHGVILRGNKQQFETIVELICDELINNGLLDNFEHTAYGLQMERLIDIFSVIYE